MTDKEQAIHDFLQNYIYYENRIKEIRSRLAKISYKITASYSPTGGFGGSGVSRKVENTALRELQLLAELAEIEKTKNTVFSALHSDSLTEREKGLARCMMAGQSLASYAEERGIYISNIYKIRDKVLKKMAKFT